MPFVARDLDRETTMNRSPLPVFLAMAVLAVLVASPARAELVLSGGGAWTGAGHGARPVGGLAWRTGIASSWLTEVRAHDGGTSLALRRQGSRLTSAFGLTPSFAAGLALGGDAPFRPSGFHLETALALPLPEGTALELAARWVVRGEDDPRGPDAFSTRFAELSLGFVFAAD